MEAAIAGRRDQAIRRRLRVHGRYRAVRIGRRHLKIVAAEIGRIQVLRATRKQRNILRADAFLNRAHLLAVLDHQIFVAGCVGNRIRGQPRQIFFATPPTPSHIAIAVLVPGRARIEAVLVEHLIVDERNRTFRLNLHEGRTDEHSGIAPSHLHQIRRREYRRKAIAVHLQDARHIGAAVAAIVEERQRQECGFALQGLRIDPRQTAVIHHVRRHVHLIHGDRLVRDGLQQRTGRERALFTEIVLSAIREGRETRRVGRQLIEPASVQREHLRLGGEPDHLVTAGDLRLETVGSVGIRHLERGRRLGRETEHLAVREGEHGEGILRIVTTRHEIAVGVLIGIDRGERVEAAQHLVEIAHAVAIRIPVARIRAKDVFLKIGEAVAVEIWTDVLSIAARIKGRHDLLGLDAGARRRLVEREAATLQTAPHAVRDGADLGVVPEIVLPAVIKSIVVGIGSRRIETDVRRPGDRSRPVGGSRVIIGMRPVQRNAGGGAVRKERTGFRIAEVVVGDTRLVQARMKATDLVDRLERHPGTPVEGGGLERIGRRGRAREEVPVTVIAGQIDKIGFIGRAIPFAATARESTTGGDLAECLGGGAAGYTTLAAGAHLRRVFRSHGVHVGDAVAVDITHVVRRIKLPREDGRREGIGIDQILIFGRKIETRLIGFPGIRGDARPFYLRAAAAGAATARAGLLLEPAVEEVVIGMVTTTLPG